MAKQKEKQKQEGEEKEEMTTVQISRSQLDDLHRLKLDYRITSVTKILSIIISHAKKSIKSGYLSLKDD